MADSGIRLCSDRRVCRKNLHDVNNFKNFVKQMYYFRNLSYKHILKGVNIIGNYPTKKLIII